MLGSLVSPISAPADHRLKRINAIIVFVAKYFLFLSVIGVAVYWLRAARPLKFTLAWQLVVGGLIALALARIGGHFYYDTRPFVRNHVKPLFPHAPDNGFPSDHALLTSFLAYSFWRYSKPFALALFVNALLVSAARVAAHVHSPIDIVGSFIFSLIGALVVVAIDRRLDRGRHALPRH